MARATIEQCIGFIEHKMKQDLLVISEKQVRTFLRNRLDEYDANEAWDRLLTEGVIKVLGT